MDKQLARIQTLAPTSKATIAALAAVSTYTLYRINASYRHWLTVGPGGLPYNFIGYFANQVLHAFFRPRHNMTDLSVYDDPKLLEIYGEDAQKSYLKEPLPYRKGPRPEVHTAIAPQRQLYETGNTPVVRSLSAHLLRDLASTNKSLEIATSKAEKRGPALFLRSDLIPTRMPKWAKVSQGEIAHFHGEWDGSGHVILLPKDAKEFVEKGWGQRHALSGSKFLPMVGFSMMYAPRNEEEVKVLERVIEAAVGAMGAK